MNTITHPHHTVAPVVETIFIDGFQFEICEFKTESARKEFGVNKTSRYFLVVEGNYFNNEHFEKMGAKVGHEIWSMYCKDKQYIKKLISDFEQKLEAVEKWQERASRIKEGKYNSAQIKADELRSDLKQKYGVHLK